MLAFIQPTTVDKEPTIFENRKRQTSFLAFVFVLKRSLERLHTPPVGLEPTTS